jgi:O-antigen/teichoic acid export membrane protein
MVSFGLLSRWLTPEGYGLLGMAATVGGFLGIVGDSRITIAVTRLQPSTTLPRPRRHG